MGINVSNLQQPVSSSPLGQSRIPLQRWDLEIQVPSSHSSSVQR